MAKKMRTRKRNSFKRNNNIRRKNTNRTRRKVSRKSSRKQHRRKRTNRRRLNMRGGSTETIEPLSLTQIKTKERKGSRIYTYHTDRLRFGPDGTPNGPLLTWSENMKTAATENLRRVDRGAHRGVKDLEHIVYSENKDNEKPGFFLKIGYRVTSVPELDGKIHFFPKDAITDVAVGGQGWLKLQNFAHSRMPSVARVVDAQSPDNFLTFHDFNGHYWKFFFGMSLALVRNADKMVAAADKP